VQNPRGYDDTPTRTLKTDWYLIYCKTTPASVVVYAGHIRCTVARIQHTINGFSKLL